MNEKHIQEVLEVEKRAEDMLAAAKREVEQLPIQAESDARDLLEKARAEAREEARRILDEAQASDEVTAIMSEVQERMGEIEKLAAKNFEKAVASVLERVVGGQ